MKKQIFGSMMLMVALLLPLTSLAQEPANPQKEMAEEYYKKGKDYYDKKESK